MKSPRQIRLAIAASGKTRSAIAEEAGISKKSLQRYEEGLDVLSSTIKAADRALAQYVRFLEPGDTVSEATVEIKGTRDIE